MIRIRALLAPVLLCVIGAIGSPSLAAEPADLAAIHAQLVGDIEEQLQQQARQTDKLVHLLLPGATTFRSPVVVSRRDGATTEDLALSCLLNDQGQIGDARVRRPDHPRVHWQQVTGELRLDEQSAIEGTIALRLRRGDQREHMERFTINFQGVSKSRKVPVQDWHIGDPGRLRQHTLDYRLALKQIPSGIYLDATLSGILPGPQAAKPMSLLVCWDPQRGSLFSRCLTPTWNRAAHRVLAEHLQITDGRLHGTLVLELNRDQWVPRRTGPRRLATLKLALDAELDGDAIETSVAVSGDFGSYTAQLRGRCGPAITGTWSVDGIDGAHGGHAVGCLSSPRQRLPGFLRTPADDPQKLYKQIAALLRLRQQRWLIDDIDIDEQTTATADNAALFRNAHRGLATKWTSRGIDAQLDPDFGPFQPELADLPADAVIPARQANAAQQWAMLRDWQGIGPVADLQWSWPRGPMLPEIDAAAVSPWSWQSAASHEHLPTAIWQALAEGPGSKPVCYARRSIEVETGGRSWLAIQTTQIGCCWLNGALIWEADRAQPAAALAVIPVVLQTGTNELLLRVGGQNLNGRYAAGADTPPQFHVAIALQGEPRSDWTEPGPVQATKETASDWVSWRGQGNARFSADRPPLAWNLTDDINVAWRRDIAGGLAGEPSCLGNTIVQQSRSGVLHIIDSDSGTERARWQSEGFTSRAPLLSEQGIWITTTTSLVHLDQQGHLLWQQDLPQPATGKIHLLLHGDLLIAAHQRDNADPKAGPEVRQRLLWAVDARSGTKRWQIALERSCRGLVILPLAADAAALVSSGGAVIDLRDGRLVHELDHGIDCDKAPVADRGRVHLRSGELAARLFLGPDGQIWARKLWDMKRFKKYGYPYWPTDPCLADGLLYVMRAAPEHSTHGPYPASHLYQSDTRTGCLISQRKPLLWDALNPTTLVAGGDLLYGVDKGGRIFGSKQDAPQVAIAQQAFPPILLGTSPGTGSTLAPVPAGDALLLPAAGELICLRLTDDSGRRYAAEKSFRAVYSREIGSRPVRESLLTIEPLPEQESSKPYPTEVVTIHRSRVTPWRWLISQAKPAGTETGIPEGMLPWCRAGTIGEWRFSLVPDEYLVPLLVNGPVGGQLLYSNSYNIDPLLVIDRQPDSEAWMFSILRLPEDRCVKSRYTGKGLTVWVNGQEVRNHQALRLKAGDYAVHARLRIGRIPPKVAKARIGVRFFTIEDPEVAIAMWEDRVRQLQDYLRWVVSQDPTGQAGREASFLLNSLTTDGPSSGAKQ